MDRTISFIVTERCNLACGYCYVRHCQPIMPAEIARAAVDLVAHSPEQFEGDGLIWDFIGGEPLLVADLIRETLAYAHQAIPDRKQRSSITTNGVLYGSPEAQRLIAEHRGCLSVSLTLDGAPYWHDAERRYPNGMGSYEDVAASVPLWLEQMGQRASTKLTISPANLAGLTESVIHLLYTLGIPQVNANPVFEVDWTAEQADVYEHQLVRLGGALRDLQVPLSRCNLFSPAIGRPVTCGDEAAWCGCGRYMTAVDWAGQLYPCNRFAPSGLQYRPGLSIGSVWTGIRPEALAPFLALSRSPQRTAQCQGCEIESGCGWCKGCDYDLTGQLEQRTTTICRMHRARVAALRALGVIS